MADNEKVKQGIKACWSEHWYHKCFDCPYKPDRDNDNTCVERLGADALELLKEQNELIEQYKNACQTCKSRLDGVKPF